MKKPRSGVPTVLFLKKNSYSPLLDDKLEVILPHFAGWSGPNDMNSIYCSWQSEKMVRDLRMQVVLI